MKILIADDHAVIRKGLKQILLEEFPSAVIEEAADAEAVIKRTFTDDWDVIICDLSMPGRSGLDVVQHVKQNFPKLPVLILSIHPEEQYAIRTLKAGAAGYLSKDTAPAELVKAALTADGTTYVHCHHGKHRGPAAAAVICRGLKNWSADDAMTWLKQAGTGAEYPGLYRDAREFQKPSVGQIAAIPSTFLPAQNIQGIIKIFLLQQRSYTLQ